MKGVEDSSVDVRLLNTYDHNEVNWWNFSGCLGIEQWTTDHQSLMVEIVGHFFKH